MKLNGMSMVSSLLKTVYQFYFFFLNIVITENFHMSYLHRILERMFVDVLWDRRHVRLTLNTLLQNLGG